MEKRNITWVDLQEQIKIIFDTSEVKSFKDVLQKDVNGWNWVLSFHNLRTESALIVHTKIIFKLDENKSMLRKNEFLYLYELDCVYKLIKFDDLGTLTDKVNNIISTDLFGEDLLYISKFMISPAMTINDYFYERKIEGYSIFDFDYTPIVDIVPCQHIRMDFKFNINNIYDIDMKVAKENDKDMPFKIDFIYDDETITIETESLDNLEGVITQFIQKNIDEV